MGKETKVIIHDSDGSTEVYTQAVVLTCKPGNVVTLNVVSCSKEDIVKSTLALTKEVERLGLMPFLMKAAAEDAKHRPSE